MGYRVYYSDHYTLPLPEGHRFPMAKYRMLRDLLVAERIIAAAQLQPSPIASRDLLCLAHDPLYVAAIENGSVDVEIVKRIGFPWTPELYARSAATVGGAVGAALAALRDGVAGNLAGGTHHAHFDRGEGYCVFNDLAVAARHLLHTGAVHRVAIVDLDVHQGNGNSSILALDSAIFVASIHGEKNYPFKKVPSSYDEGLPDGTGDEEYLAAVDRLLTAVSTFAPDFIFYQMGVDPLREDKLGKLALTFEGLMERDRRVLQFARTRDIPVSLALGGGYAQPIELSVRAYANTYRVLNEVFGFSTVRTGEAGV